MEEDLLLSHLLSYAASHAPNFAVVAVQGSVWTISPKKNGQRMSVGKGRFHLITKMSKSTLTFRMIIKITSAGILTRLTVAAESI